MAKKAKRKLAGKKQRRNDNPPRFDIYSAALFWLVRLVLMLWDRFIG